MIDVSEYIGIPYETGGRGERVDCWGLVVRVYADRLGITLPENTGYTATMTPETGAMIAAGKADWREVTEPEPFDVLLFDVDGSPNHIGLYIAPGWMLHTTDQGDSRLERYTRPLWYSRIEGFYRYDHDCRPSASAAE